MLVPLSIDDLLSGKAVGNALIAGIPGTILPDRAAVDLPRRDVLAVALLPLALIADLPARPADSGRAVGAVPQGGRSQHDRQSSNAHQLAGLLGMLSFAAAVAPSILLVFYSSHAAPPGSRAALPGRVVPLAVAASALLFIPVRGWSPAGPKRSPTPTDPARAVRAVTGTAVAPGTPWRHDEPA